MFGPQPTHRFQMQAAHDLRGNIKVIVERLQLITNSLPNYQAYHTIAIPEPQSPLRLPLIRIYVETITYLILATRYLRNGLLSMFLSISSRVTYPFSAMNICLLSSPLLQKPPANHC